MDTDTQLALIAQDIENIKTTHGKSLDEIKTALKREYVTKIEFDPVKRVVYGVLTVIVLTFVGGAIKIMFGG